MKTVSINVSNLCVPCENRCRYCLLSWDGRICGVDYDRSAAYAERFYSWIRENRPDLGFAFYYGYSMEHPKLLESIDFLRKIGSPGGKFLQFDGMAFRSEAEIHSLLTALKTHGVEVLNLTFYGTQAYHDRFAARPGDFRYLMQILKTANQVGLDVTAGIPLNQENAHKAGELLDQLREHEIKQITCFVPHGEGRGETLEPVRLRKSDYEQLPDRVKAVFNRQKFRTEGEWLREKKFHTPDRRVLTVGLTPENMEFFEQLDFGETIRYLEKLDDTYYAAVPSLTALAECYGNPAGESFYSQRDLYLKYQRCYIREHGLSAVDMNDERGCFSRRY